MTANKATGASFARGSSKQDYATPHDLRAAIVKKFGMPYCDVAADEHNHFGPTWYDEEQDGLKQDWHKHPLCFCNPPFGDIARWAKKCHEENSKGALIILLVPASVGSVWYSEHVHNVAKVVYFLSPRLCFDGRNPYPKDCLIAYYRSELECTTSYHCWRWK